MSKRKINPDEKIQAVKKYFNGEDSQRRISSELGISIASFQQWIRNYKTMGLDAFNTKKRKRYTKELKQRAVKDYLAGIGGTVIMTKGRKTTYEERIDNNYYNNLMILILFSLLRKKSSILE